MNKESLISQRKESQSQLTTNKLFIPRQIHINLITMNMNKQNTFFHELWLCSWFITMILYVILSIDSQRRNAKKKKKERKETRKLQEGGNFSRKLDRSKEKSDTWLIDRVDTIFAS